MVRLEILIAVAVIEEQYILLIVDSINTKGRKALVDLVKENCFIDHTKL